MARVIVHKSVVMVSLGAVLALAAWPGTRWSLRYVPHLVMLGRQGTMLNEEPSFPSSDSLDRSGLSANNPYRAEYHAWYAPTDDKSLPSRVDEVTTVVRAKNSAAACAHGMITLMRGQLTADPNRKTSKAEREITIEMACRRAQAVKDLAVMGKSLDRDNIFFPVFEAVALNALGDKAQARDMLHQATFAHRYDDYVLDQANDTVQALEIEHGYCGESARMSVYIGMELPHYVHLKTYLGSQTPGPDALAQKWDAITICGRMAERERYAIGILVDLAAVSMALRDGRRHSQHAPAQDPPTHASTPPEDLETRALALDRAVQNAGLRAGRPAAETVLKTLWDDLRASQRILGHDDSLALKGWWIPLAAAWGFAWSLALLAGCMLSKGLAAARENVQRTFPFLFAALSCGLYFSPELGPASHFCAAFGIFAAIAAAIVVARAKKDLTVAIAYAACALVLGGCVIVQDRFVIPMVVYVAAGSMVLKAPGAWRLVARTVGMATAGLVAVGLAMQPAETLAQVSIGVVGLAIAFGVGLLLARVRTLVFASGASFAGAFSLLVFAASWIQLDAQLGARFANSEHEGSAIRAAARASLEPTNAAGAP